LQPIHDAKAELNRRSQVCEILAGTGISRRKSIPKRTEPGARPLLRPCEVSVGMPGSLGKMDEHQGIAPCIPRWKRSVYLSTPMLDENGLPGRSPQTMVKVRLRTLCFGATAFARNLCFERRLESRAGMDFPSLARWVPQA
jgi:hypothetical protein